MCWLKSMLNSLQKEDHHLLRRFWCSWRFAKNQVRTDFVDYQFDSTKKNISVESWKRTGDRYCFRRSDWFDRSFSFELLKDEEKGKLSNYWWRDRIERTRSTFVYVNFQIDMKLITIVNIVSKINFSKSTIFVRQQSER